MGKGSPSGASSAPPRVPSHRQGPASDGAGPKAGAGRGARRGGPAAGPSRRRGPLAAENLSTPDKEAPEEEYLLTDD